MLTPEIRAMTLALPLLVTGIQADHEHPPVAADDLALLAHRLDRRSYFHARFALVVENISVVPRRGSGDRFRSPLPRRGAHAAQNNGAAGAQRNVSRGRSSGGCASAGRFVPRSEDPRAVRRDGNREL